MLCYLKKQIIKLIRLFACLCSVNTTFIIQKSCSSYLLVDKIKSIAALRGLVLSLGLSDISLLVFSNKLQLKLLKVFWRVPLSLTMWGQWRRKCLADSASFPQLDSRVNISWKPCLNLCCLK